MDTLSTEFQTSFFFQDYSTQVVETEVIINSPLLNVVLFTFDTNFSIKIFRRIRHIIITTAAKLQASVKWCYDQGLVLLRHRRISFKASKLKLPRS